MLAHPSVCCHEAGYKSHCHGIDQVNGCHSRAEQTVKHLIVCRKVRQDFSAESFACAGLFVVMPVPAVVAAVFLVSPSISDPFAAMQASGHVPDDFLAVCHPCVFSSKMHTTVSPANAGEKVFLFL